MENKNIEPIINSTLKSVEHLQLLCEHHYGDIYSYEQLKDSFNGLRQSLGQIKNPDPDEADIKGHMARAYCHTGDILMQLLNEEDSVCLLARLLSKKITMIGDLITA